MNTFKFTRVEDVDGFVESESPESSAGVVQALRVVRLSQNYAVFEVS